MQYTNPNISRFLLLFVLVMMRVSTFSQGVVPEQLTLNFENTIANSTNYPSGLRSEWTYIRTERGRTYYELSFLSNGEEVATYPVVFRNLLVTFYIDIHMDNDEEPHVFMAVYSKISRWLKLKFVADEGCEHPGADWARIEDVGGLDEVLQLVVNRIDKNLSLRKCYTD